MSVDIGECVKYVEDYAFSGCDNIKYVSIPASVAELGGRAFGFCNSIESF